MSALSRKTDSDTIVACATPPGRGGVGVIRVSGTRAKDIAIALTGKLPEPRYATLSDFAGEQDVIDSGIALWFPGPASFTGEDVFELQGHGGPVVIDLLIERIVSLGARIAEPGEFSQRAFLNDKIDLTQAEAIIDLIDADSKVAAVAAQRSLQGAFSAAVFNLNTLLTELRVHVEAAIDFPDEDIDFLDDEALKARVAKVSSAFTEIERAAREGRLLSEGVTAVLAGKPNAGKSSLLNALAGYEAAIVTDVPGTTRDLVKEHITIDGVPLHVIDTAGLRETDDQVEKEGVRRTKDQLQKADVALLVIDASEDDIDVSLSSEIPEAVPVITVLNKVDKVSLAPSVENSTVVRLSAKTGDGLDLLRQLILDTVGYAPQESGSITARRRHLAHLEVARKAFENGKLQLDSGAGELMADELLQAQNALAEITGEFTSDDLLGEIFSNFCIGK